MKNGISRQDPEGAGGLLCLEILPFCNILTEAHWVWGVRGGLHPTSSFGALFSTFSGNEKNTKLTRLPILFASPGCYYGSPLTFRPLTQERREAASLRNRKPERNRR